MTSIRCCRKEPRVEPRGQVWFNTFYWRDSEQIQYILRWFWYQNSFTWEKYCINTWLFFSLLPDRMCSEQNKYLNEWLRCCLYLSSALSACDRRHNNHRETTSVMGTDTEVSRFISHLLDERLWVIKPLGYLLVSDFGILMLSLTAVFSLKDVLRQQIQPRVRSTSKLEW